MCVCVCVCEREREERERGEKSANLYHYLMDDTYITVTLKRGAGQGLPQDL